MIPAKRIQTQFNLHMLRPGPVRDKARELAKEHYFMDLIDRGYDPYLIESKKLDSAVTVLLWNTGDHFFELAKEMINGKGNESSPN